MKNLFRSAVGVTYRPQPDERAFLERAQTQNESAIGLTVSILDCDESERFFGVAMAKHGVQPIWLSVKNGGQTPVRLDLVSIDANYFPPLEAAYACHFDTGKRLIRFAIFAWIYLPALLLLPFKYWSALSANKRMNEFFKRHGIPSIPISAGETREGFVFVPFQEGIRALNTRFMGESGPVAFSFSITVPGLKVDHGTREFETRYRPDELIDCDVRQLRSELVEQPATTTNQKGTRDGDPLNLVVIGDFDAILESFGARWDETEVIDFRTSVKTARAFVFGSTYRYSPVSPLYLDGRQQDFALQRARAKINERLHLRLWYTPLRYQGQAVWVGQISRDIGVRLTLKTWNLTTHKIDPDVDEAREYVLSDLIGSQHASAFGYVPGVAPCTPAAPGRNLTGDPYHTDGKRAVIVLSADPADAAILDWESPA